MPANKYLSINEAARLLKVSTKTLRRWEKSGRLSAIRTDGGHRRYELSKISSFKKTKQRTELRPTKPILTKLEVVEPKPFQTYPQQEISFFKPDIIEPQYTQIFEPLHFDQVKFLKRAKYASLFFLLTLIVFASSATAANALKQRFPVLRTYLGSSEEKIAEKDIAQVLATRDSLLSTNININVNADFQKDVDIAGNLNLSGNTVSSTSDLVITPLGGGVSVGPDTPENIDLADNDLFVSGDLESNGDIFAVNSTFTGSLTLTGTFISTGDLLIDPGGGGVSVGTGTAGSVDLAGDDLYVTGDLEVDGSSFLPTLVIGGDTLTDLTGTGLQVSSGVLEATLGTSIDSSEISDDTVSEVDLKVSNSPTADYLLSYNSSTGGFTWVSEASTQGITTVQESDVTINAVPATTVDFLGGDFDLSESPSAELNVQLATTLTSVTGVAANFDVAGQLTVGTADAVTITTAGEIQIPSTQTLQIGTIELNDVGASNVTSGAALIGAFDEFANSSGTNIQDVLDDLDSAIGAGGSKWTQDTGFTYLTSTTDDLVLGGSTVAGGSLYFDESAGSLYLGTNEATNGTLTLYSSGAGITDASITTNSSGNLIIDSTNFDVTTTGINATVIGATTRAAGNFTTLAANSTVTLSALTTAGPVITDSSGVLSSEATLALTRGGTGRSLTASNGQVVYSDADSLELTTGGTSNYCLKFQSASAPTWSECVTSAQVPFTSDGTVITKTTIGEYLSLRYGDAADTQLEIQNTTSGTIPAADSMVINLTGGSTGVVTDGADGLYIAAEYGNGTANTNSLLHLALNPVNTPSGDETFYAINIDGLTGTSATEVGVNLGSGWDRELNFADTSPTVSIANTGTLSITDGTNTLFSITDDTSEGDVTATGDLAVNGATSADITSSTTTASLFNSTVTTLNIGGAATTLNLADGAITGTIDIGGVTADGATTVNIATNSTSSDTITIGNTNASTTLALTGGDDWTLAATGVLTLSASASQTTAILITDTDYTNALSIADNNIIGSTAGISFDDFTLSSDGLITFASDGAGDQLSIVTPAADFQALVVDATTNDSTQTAGMIDLNVDSSTNTAVGGLYTTFTAVNDDAADTLYAQRTDIAIQNDTTASDTVYGQYIDITQNDTTPATIYGLAIVANDNGAAAVSAGILVDNLQATDIDITDGILIRATTNDSIADGLDVSDAEITNAINIGANAIAGTNFAVSAAGTISIASGQTLTIGTTSLNETTATADSGASLVGTFDEFTNSDGANVQDVLDDLDAAIGAGSSKWSINTTPTPDVLYPTGSDTPAGNDLAIGGTTITAAPFAVDVSANTIYIGDAATAGSTSVIFKSDAGADTGTLLYNTSDQFEFTAGNVFINDNLILSSDASQGISGGGLTDCDDAVNSKLLWDTTTNKFSCGTDGGAGTGSSKWTDGGAITYLTATTDDLAVGASNTLTAPFSVDVSANTVRIGDATAAGNAILSLFASDGTTGNLTYNTSDQFQFSGGDILVDQDLTVTGGDILSAATANLLNATSTTINFAGAATTLNIADAAITGTIDIGGVTANGTTTINVATNSTSADTIAIGNSNASTTVAITGGDDWLITAAGALDINGQFDLGDGGDTGTINTSDWDINSTGDMTGIGAITADGAIAFTPGSTSDIVFTNDADSNFQIASTIASDVTLNVVDITLNASGTGATNTLNGLAITNAAAAGTTSPDSLIYVAQSDTDETVTNGLFIENTAGGTLSTGLRITETAGTITDAILISGTLGTILNTDSLDISGGGAITGATGLVSSGTVTFSGLSTGVVTNTSGTLSSEAQLALTRGGTNKNVTAAAGAVFYSDSDSFELTAVGTTGQCLISNGTAAPSWTSCDNASTTPFTTSGGIIDKTTAGDSLRLLYGDAADTQLTIENTTNGTIPTADGVQIDLTGGTTGIVTDGVDGLYIAAEFGNGTSSTRSGIRLNLDPIDSPTSDDTFYALNIDGLSGSSAVENAINIGAGWDRGLVIDAASTNSSLAGSTSGIIQLSVDGDPAAGSTNQGIYLDYETIDDANADQTFRAERIDFLNSSEDAADTTYALSISNSNNTSGTAVATDALIHLDNADATASSLTDGIVITSSGVDTGITDAIDVSNANIVNAINFGANFTLYDGLRAFSPSSGTWTLEDTSGNDLISAVDAGAISIGSSAVGTTAITLATDSTGDAEVVLPTGSVSGTEILDDTVVLTTDTSGNYVATITAGNGISGASSTEGGTPTIALSSLTANWSQTGAFDIVLNNASSELSFLESSGGAFFGTIDVGDLGADRTYTFPDATGTVCLSTGNCTGLGGEITGSGTAGQTAFFTDADSITSEDNFEWDATNNVLSLGTGSAAADTSALLDLYGESEYQVLRPADVTADGDTNNSPILRLRGTYDSDVAVGPVTSSNFNFDIRNIMTAAGASPASRLDFLNNSSAQVLSISSAGVVTIPGSADGTDALVLTAGDVLVSDGDFDLSGGDFNVVLDAGDGVNISKGAAPTVDVVTIAGGSPATNGVDALALSLTATNQTDFTNSLINGTLTAAGTASTDIARGLFLDLASQAGGTEKAIEIENTAAWDTDIELQNDETISNTSDGTIALGAATLSLVGGTTIVSDQATVALLNATTTTVNAFSAATTVNIADAAITGTIDIGGVTADGATTINIATNSTSADTLTIGNSNASTLLTLTGGDDWNISNTGIMTLSASAAQTTAIVATDTDYTNFASIADNNILGTTAAINFDFFDVSAAGAITTGGATQDGQLIIYNDLATDRTITFNPSTSQAADITYTLPPDDGTADNQVLTTDSNGLLQWETVTGAGAVSGSGTAGQIAYFDGTNSITSETSGFGWDATNNILALTATGSTATDGVLNLDFSSATDAFEGINISLNVTDDAGVDTLAGSYVSVDNDATTADDNVYALQIENSSSSTGNLDAGLYINNLDTAQTIDDAIRIASSGGGAITTGIDFDDTDIVTDIELQNAETISNDTNGTIALGATTLSLVGGTTIVSDQATVALLNATTTTVNAFSAATTVNIADAAITGTIDIGGVTADGATTINIATNATSADVITIGNSLATTTTAIIGGDDWSINTAGDFTGENVILSTAATTSIDLTRSSAGQWISFNDGTDLWGLYNTAGSPEGALAANTGALSMDTTNGTLYVKTDDTDNTGWVNLATGGTSPFTSASGIIDKTTIGDRLRLWYGDAGDVQLEIENTTNAVVPTADTLQLNLSGGSGITTDNVNGIYVNIEGANGTSTDVSALRLNFDPISGSSDDTFTALLIEGVTGTSAVENAITIGSGWDANMFYNDTTTQIQIADTGVFTWEDSGGNDLATLTDNSNAGDFVLSGDLTVTGGDIVGAATTNLVNAATTVNLGSTAVTRTINIGTGTNADTINIGTGASNADTITFGNTGVATTFTVNSGATTGTPVTFNLDTVTTATAIDLSLDGLTTGTGLLLDDNTAAGLSSGTLLQAQTVTTDTTAITDGLLGYFNWAPGSSTTKTGDLFRINIGSSGNIDNLFNVTDNGSSLFKVSETAITSALPHSFTAAGDVSIAYDLQFTNQTASVIKSNAPLTIEAGESSENNNLTLKTYGTGKIIADGGFSLNTQATLPANDTTPSVGGDSFFLENNSSNTVVTNFDDGTAGQIIVMEITDTDIDFDCTSNANFNCGTTDLTTAAGDTLTWIFDGTQWSLISYMDNAQDQNDLAEWFPTNGEIIAGEIVSIDSSQPVKVQKAIESDEQRVIGVISTEPGLILGQAEEGIPSALVALAGRVPVKVDPTSEAIANGDLIGASATAGLARKVTGGWIIGRALEAWNPSSGQGTVTIFVNPIYVNEAQLAQTNYEDRITNLETDMALLQAQLDSGEQGATTESFTDLAVTNLSVLGDTILADTVVNGKLNVGTLTFDNVEQSINAVGVLKVQDLALGNIEFLGGLITFDTDGNIIANEITAEKYSVSGASAGTGTLLSGTKKVFVETTMATENSLVFVTPGRALAFPLAVTEKEAGVGFWVELPAVQSLNTEFDWFIVDRVAAE